MFTDSAQHQGIATPPAGVLTRVGEQVRQLICGLHGHDSLLHFEQGRISLLCSSCGHETPGWDVQGAPTRHQVADSNRRVVAMPFVRERRVA
jgi:hypothetical protein